MVSSKVFLKGRGPPAILLVVAFENDARTAV
jgi:hypothetical protein